MKWSRPKAEALLCRFRTPIGRADSAVSSALHATRRPSHITHHTHSRADRWLDRWLARTGDDRALSIAGGAHVLHVKRAVERVARKAGPHVHRIIEPQIQHFAPVIDVAHRHYNATISDTVWLG